MSLFRKTPPPAPLTNDAFARWLRAKSPQPLAFFLSLGELEQETLAGLGDDYTEDLMIASAFATRDPDAADPHEVYVLPAHDMRPREITRPGDPCRASLDPERLRRQGESSMLSFTSWRMSFA